MRSTFMHILPILLFGTVSVGTDKVVAQSTFEIYGGVPIGHEGRWNGGLYDPRSAVPAAEQRSAVEIRLAANEYESATLTVASSGGSISDLNLHVSDLVNGTHVISASAIDIRTVKWWYQTDKRNPDQRMYVPELLLHDDSVVLSSNHVTQDNTLKYDMNSIRDAAALQPTTLQDQHLKQYWLTVHADTSVTPGTYSGTVTVTSTNGGTRQLPIDITVHPFELQDTSAIFGVYDQISVGPVQEAAVLPLGGTEPGQGASVFGNRQSTGQYARNLTLMRQYGITHPAHYSDPLKQIIPLREMFGPPVAGQPYFSAYGATNWPDDEIIRVRDAALAAGASDVYILTGIDEPTEIAQFSELRRQINHAHTLGVKVFGSLESSQQGSRALQYLGGILDVPLFKLNGNSFDLARWKAVSEMVLGISYPRSFDEAPVELRQAYGLNAWARGFDGIMAYAYQTSYGGGNVWDDFDDGNNGSSAFGWDMNMAYKVASGDPVPTLQLAGFREAQDDMRYLSTLFYWLALAEQTSPDALAVLNAATFIDELSVSLRGVHGVNPGPDLPAIRIDMVHHILALQQVVPEPSTAMACATTLFLLIGRTTARPGLKERYIPDADKLNLSTTITSILS